MRECKGLGALLLNFNNKACLLVPTTVACICILMVTGTTRPFVYKDMAICTCPAAKQTRINRLILLFLDDLLMLCQAFGMNLSITYSGLTLGPFTPESYAAVTPETCEHFRCECANPMQVANPGK